MSLLVTLISLFWFDIPNLILTSSMSLCDFKNNPRRFQDIVVALKIEEFYLRGQSYKNSYYK